MSAIIAPPADGRLTSPSALSPTSASGRRLAPGDRTIVGILVLLFVAIAALTWRKWGMPEGDAGAELTTADLIRHGAVVYQDVRYFYGPLGVYLLALALLAPTQLG
mgnify:CR=1 FL=1